MYVPPDFAFLADAPLVVFSVLSASHSVRKLHSSANSPQLFLFSLAAALILHNAIAHMSHHKRPLKTLLAWLLMSLFVYSFGALMYTLVLKAFGHRFPRDHQIGKRSFSVFWFVNFATMLIFGTIMDAIFAVVGISWGMLLVLLCSFSVQLSARS